MNSTLSLLKLARIFLMQSYEPLKIPYPTSLKTPIPLLELHNIGPGTVTDLIKSLENKSSCDIDGISTSLLKHVHEISTPLAHIFNLSLSSGIFPESFKISRIVPIHKSGDTTNCDNYRPLVSTISKILEKLVANYLTNHLELNNLI
jgi:hypothetical protein